MHIFNFNTTGQKGCNIPFEFLILNVFGHKNIKKQQL